MYKYSFQWHYDRWAEGQKPKAARSSGYQWGDNDTAEEYLLNDRLYRKYEAQSSGYLIWSFKNGSFNDRAKKVVLFILYSRGIDIESIIRDARGAQEEADSQEDHQEEEALEISFRTHYDNLQVSRNSSYEVIRAAYRNLSQKYHPDKNPGDPKAEKIMRIINASYEALSDPDKRRRHDDWIDEMFRKKSAGSKQERSPPRRPDPPRPNAAPQWRPPAPKAPSHFRRWWLVYAGMTYALFALFSASDKSSTIAYTPPSGSRSSNSHSSPARLRYVRASTAPNGNPWPQASGYVKGYIKKLTDGLSTVTIDNSASDTDVFVKIFSLDGTQIRPIRHIFIRSGDRFTAKSIRSGNYDVRYMVLDSGFIYRSEPFELNEIELPDVVQYSNISMTLYKVPNGNMQTYPLSADEFDDDDTAMTSQ